MDRPIFHVQYATHQSLSKDIEQQIAMRGLLLRTATELDQFTKVIVRILAPGNEVFELHAEVIQVVPGQGLAVQFSADAQSAIDSLSALAKKTTAGPSPSQEVEPRFFGPGETPPQPGASGRPAASGNIQQDVENMSVAEKRQAALHGRKDMRMLLIRDRNKTLHPFIIRNPAITLGEIEQIAKMPSVNPDVLRTIAKSKDWNRSVAVCRNLVRNPKTPMKEALDLLKRLPKSDIRAMAKSGNVRTPIQHAARKLALN